MRLLMLVLAALVATSCTTHTEPVFIPVPTGCDTLSTATTAGGCWIWHGEAGLPVTSFGAALTVNRDSTIQGSWVGWPADCQSESCADFGAVIVQRSRLFSNDSVVVELPAATSGYSLVIGGRVAGDRLTGSIALVRGGLQTSAVRATLDRLH